jgi:hypothetical protein
MSFITRAQLNDYQLGFTEGKQYIRAKQAEATALNSWQADVGIFLSHSHKDKDLIHPAIAFLRSHGVKVYVDWLDAGMPDVVSGDTANKIKEKIKEHKKFLVLVTENSKDSRWVPWELGFADPTKGMAHIASFPVAEKEDFAQNEYMKIYPKICVFGGTWYVWQDDPTAAWLLTDWLRR